MYRMKIVEVYLESYEQKTIDDPQLNCSFNQDNISISKKCN